MALCERCKVKTNKTWSTKLEKKNNILHLPHMQRRRILRRNLQRPPAKTPEN